MPWKETQKMDQRIEFVMKSLHTQNFRELCQQYGISAKTGYKWQERFLSEGLYGMAERSRRPHGHADELREGVVCEIVRLKQAHPHWGPRKIQELYRRKHCGEIPSESSFKRVLERAGLTVARRRKRSVETGRLSSGVKAQEANDVWTVDFKGWWRSREGERVEPLTVRDEYSRMILELRSMPDARGESVRKVFEGLFERHGLPRAIRSDNGTPFGCMSALLGLTRLSAWWLALGINLERNRPRCPQDNGGHERMHRDISLELQRARVGQDQEAFDLWRQEYNSERPHEALAMRVPAEVYRRSDREYEGTPEDIDYGSMETRKVTVRAGTIGCGRERIFLSTALGGWSVGLNACQDSDLLEVWFSTVLLGHLDLETAGFKPSSTQGARAKARSSPPAGLAENTPE
jgi:transposase InsO family protein